MQSYSRPLGDAVKRARAELGFTQNQVAEAADIDVRTVLNIENYKGNPKMEVLFPLVRVLKMDSREIFYPEMRRESPAIRRLRFLIEECSEEEAEALAPAIESILVCIEIKNSCYGWLIIKKRACVPYIREAGSSIPKCQALCLLPFSVVRHLP